MADESINIELLIQTANSAKSIGDVKKSLKELKSAALQIGEGGKGFEEITKAAGELTDTMSDLNARVKFVGDDLAGLKSVVGVAEGIASGFAVVEGTMAALGFESDDLSKQMVKLQGIMIALNGIQQIGNLLQKESSVYIGIQTLATKAASVAQLIYTTAIGTTTGALKLFRIALLATGIGAIVVGIGLLITNWEKLTKTITNSTFSLEKYTKSQQDFNKSLKDSNEYLERQNQIRLTNQKAVEGFVSRSSDATKREIDLLKARGASIDEIYKKEKELGDVEARLAESRLKNLKESNQIEQQSELLKKLKEKQKQDLITLETEQKRLINVKKSIELSNQLNSTRENGSIRSTEDVEKEISEIDKLIKNQKLLIEAKKAVQKEETDIRTQIVNLKDEQIKAELEVENALTRNQIRDIEYNKEKAELLKKNKTDNEKIAEDEKKRLLDIQKENNEERLKLLQDNFKNIEQQIKVLKLNETIEDIFTPEEIINRKLKEFTDIEEQFFNQTELNQRNRLKVNESIYLEEVRLKNESVDKLLIEDIRYLTLEKDLKVKSIKSLIVDEKTKNDLLLEEEEKYQNSIQELNIKTQTLKIKTTKETNEKIKESERLSVEDRKRIFGQLWKDLTLQTIQTISTLDAAYTQNRIANIESIKQNELKSFDEVTKAYWETQEELTNADRYRRDKQEEFARDRVEIERKFDEQKKLIEYQAQVRQWQYSLARATTEIALAVIAGLSSPAIPPFPSAIAAGVIGAVQLGTMLATPPQRFAKGGLVKGSGTGTSDSIPTMLSNGESVINARSTGMFLPMLDKINQMGGGSPLMKSPQRLATGGLVQSTSEIDTRNIEKILENMVNRPIKTYVVSSDMTNAQNGDTRLKKRTSF